MHLVLNLGTQKRHALGMTLSLMVVCCWDVLLLPEREDAKRRRLAAWQCPHVRDPTSTRFARLPLPKEEAEPAEQGNP